MVCRRQYNAPVGDTGKLEAGPQPERVLSPDSPPVLRPKNVTHGRGPCAPAGARPAPPAES